MNSIIETEFYKFAKKIYEKDLAKISSKNLGMYEVPSNFYEHFIRNIRNYRHKLNKAVIESLQNGSIKFVILNDPLDIKNKNDTITIPYHFCTFLKKVNNNIVSYVDVSNKAEFYRDKKTSSRTVTDINIEELDFYAYAQMALLNLKLRELSKVINRTTLPKVTSEIYSLLTAICIDASYSISTNRANTDILRFLCAMYCLQVMFKIDTRTAKQIALSSRLVSKSDVLQNSINVRNDTLKMDNINELLSLITEEFNFIDKEKFSYRTLIYSFNRMFGPNSSLAVEHGFSFLNMILTARFNLRFYTDKAVNLKSERYSTLIENTISQLIYRG